MATSETIKHGSDTQSTQKNEPRPVEESIRRHNPNPVPEEEPNPGRPEAEDSELQHQGSVE